MRVITASCCPECPGWAAEHFAAAVGMWHNHDGRHADFEPREFVDRESFEELRSFVEDVRGTMDYAQRITGYRMAAMGIQRRADELLAEMREEDAVA